MASAVRNYLQLMRAPAVFTAASNIFAAFLVSKPSTVSWYGLLFVLLTSICLYAAGMVLNDCYDYAEDCRDRPGRPLPSGRIGLNSAWLLGWLLLAGGLIFAAFAGGGPLLIAGLLALLIVLYDGYAKRFLLGVLVMGGCRYMNWLLGLSIQPLELESFLLALPVFLYVCSLTLLSRVETSAANQTYLIGSFAGMLLAAGVVAYIQLKSLLWPLPALLVLLALLSSLGFRFFKTYRDFSPAQIQKTMKFLIMGIIPLDALLVLSLGSVFNALLILLLLLPGWWLARNMRVT